MMTLFCGASLKNARRGKTDVYKYINLVVATVQ